MLLNQDSAVAGGAPLPASANCAPPIFQNIQLASPSEGISDSEHEEFGERDTLD